VPIGLVGAPAPPWGHVIAALGCVRHAVLRPEHPSPALLIHLLLFCLGDEPGRLVCLMWGLGSGDLPIRVTISWCDGSRPILSSLVPWGSRKRDTPLRDICFRTRWVLAQATPKEQNRVLGLRLRAAPLSHFWGVPLLTPALRQWVRF